MAWGSWKTSLQKQLCPRWGGLKAIMCPMKKQHPYVRGKLVRMKGGKRAFWESSLRLRPFAVQIHKHRHHLNGVTTVAPLQVDCLRHSRHQKWTRKTDGLRNVSGVNPMRNLGFFVVPGIKARSSSMLNRQSPAQPHDECLTTKPTALMAFLCSAESINLSNILNT